MSIAATYRTYTDEDKAALKELTAEMEEKVGTKVKLSDAVAAVEPGMVTPDFLLNV